LPVCLSSSVFLPPIIFPRPARRLAQAMARPCEQARDSTDGLLELAVLVLYHKDVEIWCRSGRDLMQLIYTAASMLELRFLALQLVRNAQVSRSRVARGWGKAPGLFRGVLSSEGLSTLGSHSLGIRGAAKAHFVPGIVDGVLAAIGASCIVRGVEPTAAARYVRVARGWPPWIHLPLE
jgi:hypothetical protein